MQIVSFGNPLNCDSLLIDCNDVAIRWIRAYRRHERKKKKRRLKRFKIRNKERGIKRGEKLALESQIFHHVQHF